LSQPNGTGLASLGVLPYALYILARMLVGDFFSINRRLQISAALVLVAISIVGFVVGVNRGEQ
jgi:hypothetical protein